MSKNTPLRQSVAAPRLADRLAMTVPSAGERLVVWTIWFSYGVFYFCRTNISAAVDGMGMPIEQGGLDLSKDQIGWILASMKISYGIGQLVNGQLSERLPPRILLAIGMFGSAALNVLFGFSTGALFLLFVWACNGYCQSLGWTPCVRVIGNWVPVLRRGNAFGIVGTGYQLTLGLTYFVSGQAAEMLGWRGAMFAPAAILAAAGVVMLFLLEESPDKSRNAVERSAEAYRPSGLASQSPNSTSRNLVLTLANPALWLLGMSLGLLNACRYGFVDWGIKHLIDVQQIGVGKAALTFVVLAAGATVGSWVAGWATDRFFGSRRAPVICILLLFLSLLTLVYEYVARLPGGGLILIGLLFVIGFCIYGPQVLLVGTAPADLARHGTSAAAAGFVNFMGYMGAAAGDVATGYLSPKTAADGQLIGDWKMAIYVWSLWALAAAICTAVLWNTTARTDSPDEELRP